MKKNTNPKRTRADLRSGRSKWQILLFKITIRMGFVIIFCTLLYTVKSGIYHLFFSSNNHFQLRRIEADIVKGILTEDEIRKRINFQPHVTNVFSIDPGDLRKKLLDDSLIQEAEVRRLLPDTLKITIYGRNPIAQIIHRGGRLIDSEGILLQATLKSELQKLPIITGISAINRYQVGEKLDIEMVQFAIQFLKLKALIPNGNWLDVHLIQLNENFDECRVYLNEKKECFIRAGALLILPNKKIKEALGRTMSILEQRALARQPTSFIDATYEKRVPVRP